MPEEKKLSESDRQKIREAKAAGQPEVAAAIAKGQKPPQPQPGAPPSREERQKAAAAAQAEEAKAAKGAKAGAESDEGPSKEDLMEQAQALDIPGRSQMNKDELAKAIAKAEAAAEKGEAGS